MLQSVFIFFFVFLFCFWQQERDKRMKKRGKGFGGNIKAFSFHDGHILSPVERESGQNSRTGTQGSKKIKKRQRK